MRILSLKCGLTALLALLMAALGLPGPGPAYAANPIVGPTQPSTFVIMGAWNDSNVRLAAPVPRDPMYQNILIDDQSYLGVGWTVRVDNEEMYVRHLIDGVDGNPDTMVVYRGTNGTMESHSQNASVKAHTITLEIWAQNITDSYGFGGFGVDLTFPPEVQYIKMLPRTQWIGSTGRDVWCEGPLQPPGSDAWHVACWTLGSSPPGPTGSGAIATVTLLPPESGLSTVSLAGSVIANAPGDQIPATVRDLTVKMIECPDANLDTRINSGDMLLVAKSSNDRGQDSGTTLVSAVDNSQTNMEITDQSLLAVDDTISIDAELMRVDALQEGTPDTMTVTRGFNYPVTFTHSAGAHVFRGTADGNLDGKKNYTWARDVNRDGVINSGDMLVVARTQGMSCPQP